MRKFRHILVVIRHIENAAAALHEGIQFAKLFDAPLSILRVYSNPVDMEAVNAPGLFIRGEEYTTYLSMRDRFREELDQAFEKVTTDGVPFRIHVSREKPVDEIVRIVAEERVDLVIGLAHEEGRLEHALFGGEHDELIRRLPCSVLLLKHETKSLSDW